MAAVASSNLLLFAGMHELSFRHRYNKENLNMLVGCWTRRGGVQVCKWRISKRQYHRLSLLVLTDRSSLQGRLQTSVLQEGGRLSGMCNIYLRIRSFGLILHYFLIVLDLNLSEKECRSRKLKKVEKIKPGSNHSSVAYEADSSGILLRYHKSIAFKACYSQGHHSNSLPEMRSRWRNVCVAYAECVRRVASIAQRVLYVIAILTNGSSIAPST